MVRVRVRVGLTDKVSAGWHGNLELGLGLRSVLAGMSALDRIPESRDDYHERGTI